MVPARGALPLLPPRALRCRRAARLPGGAGALRLALRHRGGGRGHARRPGLPGALERVRAGTARSLRGADGRGPPLAGHGAGMDHPARGSGPPPALVAGRDLRRLLGPGARRPAGHPARHPGGPGSRARGRDPGQRDLRAALAHRGRGRRRGLLPVLLAVERPVAGGPGDRAPHPHHRGEAGHRPGRPPRGRLRRLRGPGGSRGDGPRAALARGRPDRDPVPPARRPGLPAARLPRRSAHRFRAPAGRTARHRHLGSGTGGARDERRRARYEPGVAPRRPPALLVRPERHPRHLPLRAGGGRLAGGPRDRAGSDPPARARHAPLARAALPPPRGAALPAGPGPAEPAGWTSSPGSCGG